MYDDDEDDDYGLDSGVGETVPCPECGKEVYEQAQKCPYCGSYIVANSAWRSSKPTWIIVTAVILLLALIPFLLL